MSTLQPHPRWTSAASETAEYIAKLLAAAAAVAITFTLARTGVLRDVVTHPVVFCLTLDCYLIHICTGAGKKEAIGTTLLAAAGWLILPLAMRRPFAWPGEAVAAFGCLLGFASLLVLSVGALVTHGEKGKDKLRTLGRASVFICMAGFSVPFLAIMTAVRPERFDTFLYRFDAGFGFQPGFWMGRIFAAAPAFHNFEYYVYVSLALPVGLLYIGYIRHPRQWPLGFLQAVLSNSIIGYVLFWIFPAAGPGFAFAGRYPFQAPPLSALNLHPSVFTALPNAMPSVHVSTALLVWFNSRPWPKARTLALAFLLLTIVSTLGLGEHYLVDVVVAFPYALAIQSLSVRHRARNRGLLLGAALTIAWFLLLRLGQPIFPSPAIAYPAAALTLAYAVWEERNLAVVVFGRGSETMKTSPVL